jgi:hypothetical protein
MLQKMQLEKVTSEKIMENGVFYFYYYVQKVGKTFFSLNFVAFYATDSKSA